MAAKTKSKGGRRQKFEKLDLAEITSTPTPVGAWGTELDYVPDAQNDVESSSPTQEQSKGPKRPSRGRGRGRRGRSSNRESSEAFGSRTFGRSLSANQPLYTQHRAVWDDPNATRHQGTETNAARLRPGKAQQPLDTIAENEQAVTHHSAVNDKSPNARVGDRIKPTIPNPRPNSRRRARGGPVPSSQTLTDRASVNRAAVQSQATHLTSDWETPVPYVPDGHLPGGNNDGPWLEGEIDADPGFQVHQPELHLDWSDPAVSKPGWPKRDPPRTSGWGNAIAYVSPRPPDPKRLPDRMPKIKASMLTGKYDPMKPWDPQQLFRTPADEAKHQEKLAARKGRSRRCNHKSQAANSSSPTCDGNQTNRASASITKTARQTKTGMMDLADEILELILLTVLQNKDPISVDMDLQQKDDGTAEMLNYSVLHVCRRLYKIGIPLYYRLNTFKFDLSPLGGNASSKLHGGSGISDVRPLFSLGQTEPQNPKTNQWTTIGGFHIAREEISKVVVTHFSYEWIPTVGFLLGFDNLTDIGFDLRRQDLHEHEQPGWETMEINEELRGILENCGIRVPSPNIWVGHLDLERAVDAMEDDLAPGLIEGAQRYLPTPDPV